MIKVSIIVPVWNVEKYLLKCLDSLVNQTLKEIEILVINDGSPDNSQLIIDEYAKKYNRIKSFIKENGGQASARNFGIKKAVGEFIMFVDSDDWVDEEIALKMYNKAMIDNSNIVICKAKKVYNDQIDELETFHNYSNDFIKNYILNCTEPWGKLIKRDILIKNNLYFLEKHFYEDIAIIPSLCLFDNKISYLDESLYYYLIRSGSTMKQVSYTNSLEDIFDSLENLTNIFIKMNSDKIYMSELEYLYIEHLLHAASLRFFKFNKRDQLDKIVQILHDKYPNWQNNKYYKNQNLKYKIICVLFYKKKYRLLKLFLKG